MRSGRLTRCGRLAPLLLVLALGDAAAAQEPPASTFLDRVDVEVVEVDVVVLDGDGRPVAGLAREDFELREDGRPVEIVNFLAYATEAPLPAAVEPDGDATAAAPVTRTAVAPPPRTWLVFVDQDRLDPGPRAELMRQLASFAAAAIRPEDRALVASFDGVALRLDAALGSGPAPVVEALGRLERRRGYLSNRHGRRSMLRNELLRNDPPADFADEEAERLLAEVDQFAEEEVQATRAAIAAALDALALAADVEGRVAVLFAAGGYDSRPGESLYELLAARFGNYLERGSTERTLDERWASVARARARLLAAVSAARFTVYAIQAGARGPEIDADVPGSPTDFAVPSTAGDASALRAGSVLGALAEETGGRTLVAAPDLARRLGAASDELSTYYSLGYRAVPAEGRRRIAVQVRRDGLTVRHRAAVASRAATERAAGAALNALLGTDPAANPFDAVLELGRPAAAGRKGVARVPLVVRVPLRALTLLPEGARHQAKLRFQFAVRDPDGGLRQLEDRLLAFEVPNERLAGALGQSVAMALELELAPGDHGLAVSVLDELAGSWSAVAGRVTVPPP